MNFAEGAGLFQLTVKDGKQHTTAAFCPFSLEILNWRITTMKILSSRMLLTGLLVLGVSATLLMQPAQSLMAQQSAPQPSKTFVLPFPGVWSGTYRYVGGNGQVLLYISAAGGLFGSFASDDGLQFAQISGDHRSNACLTRMTPKQVRSSP